MDLLRKRRLLSLFALSAAVLALPASAGAQAGLRFPAITVALWPEYDQPEVLVIYRVTLPDDLALPTTVEVPVPAGAAALTAVAYRDATSGLVNAVYDRREGEAFDTVSIQAASREVQLEYYDALGMDGELRTYQFAWPGGVAVDDLAFEIQQPLAAQSFSASPPGSTTSTDPLGLIYHHLSLGPQTSADRPSVSFSYRNPSGSLSEELAASTAAPLATPAAASGAPPDVTSILPWILLIVGVALIAGGVVYYVRVVRAGEQPPRPRHRPAPRPTGREREVDASPVFCHNCGTQASASDRFCRTCGTALRT